MAAADKRLGDRDNTPIENVPYKRFVEHITWEEGHEKKLYRVLLALLALGFATAVTVIVLVVALLRK